MYHLNDDPSETKNIYHEYPEKVEELRQELIRLFDNGRSTEGAIQDNWIPEEWFQVNFK